MYPHQYVVSIIPSTNFSEFAAVSQKFELCYSMLQDLHSLVKGLLPDMPDKLSQLPEFLRKASANRRPSVRYTSPGEGNMLVFYYVSLIFQ